MHTAPKMFEYVFVRVLYVMLLAFHLGNTAAPRPEHACDPEKDEMFTFCGTACPDTCDNYTEIRTCTLECVMGCVCPRGTVRRESDDYCVQPEDCGS